MQTEIRNHRHGHRVALMAIGLAGAAIAAHWGWNSAATLFGLPEARFAQSFAALCGLGAAAAVAGWGFRLALRGK